MYTNPKLFHHISNISFSVKNMILDVKNGIFNNLIYPIISNSQSEYLYLSHASRKKLLDFCMINCDNFNNQLHINTFSSISCILLDCTNNVLIFEKIHVYIDFMLITNQLIIFHINTMKTEKTKRDLLTTRKSACIIGNLKSNNILISH